MDNGIEVFIGYSLVDITATGVIRGGIDKDTERNQQRNWETVVQCLGLRTQPTILQLPEVTLIENHGLHDYGEFYHNQPQKIWSWVWTVEKTGIYDLHDKPLGGLLQDLEQVPIVTGLSETAKFLLPIFYPYGTIRNIYIERYIS